MSRKAPPDAVRMMRRSESGGTCVAGEVRGYVGALAGSETGSSRDVDVGDCAVESDEGIDKQTKGLVRTTLSVSVGK
eukprot:3603233-Pleurochrysis_carterae.AAC.1